MTDISPLLDAIDDAYRLAVKYGLSDVAGALLMASLDVSQRIEPDDAPTLRRAS